MYFFDSKFLNQYLQQGIDLKVYVDGDYFTVADASDLESATYGVGYDTNGKPHIFDYRSVEQVKTGNNIFTLDQLQTTVSGEAPPEGGESDPGGGNPAPDTGGAPGGEPPLNIPGEKPANAGAPPQGGETAPEDEEEPEPPQESARKIMGRMLQEAKSKENTAASGFVKGDIVENIDMKCEFRGSRGAVTNVDMPEDKNGVAAVEYRIFNYGYNFKPGQKVIKLANQLLKIGKDE